MMASMQEQMEKLRQLAESMAPLPLPQVSRESPRTNLNEMVTQALKHAAPFAQQGGLVLAPDLPAGYYSWDVTLAKYNEALKYAPNWKQLKEARAAAAKAKA
jgi:hypothetical protein